MITTGVLGHGWRASVTPWGAVQPWAEEHGSFDWYVAADDRWHVPADEATVRQVRVEGTAVVETRLRVPRGDIVHTVYSVADGDGLTVIEILNESTLPVAVAFNRRDLLTERPIAAVPIEGIDLPADAFALPLGHQASLRVAIRHGGGGNGPLPAGLPTAVQVARGWLTVVERAGRTVLPDGEIGSELAARVAAERCELALGVIPTADEDPAGFAVALEELVRMGERPDPWLPELVDAVASLGGRRSWSADAGLAAAGRVLSLAGEHRARRDLERIVARRDRSARPSSPPAGVLAVAWLASLLADGSALLPVGFPEGWLGQPIEVYGVPTVLGSTTSFAIRWHGARPAVLWEQSGEPVELCAPVVAPAWRSSETKGEALWPDPSGST